MTDALITQLIRERASEHEDADFELAEARATCDGADLAAAVRKHAEAIASSDRRYQAALSVIDAERGLGMDDG